MFDNYFNTGIHFHYTFVCSFFLDCMNSVGITELNNISNVFILVWKEENDPKVRNVLVLLFRFVWIFHQTKPEVIKRSRLKTLYRKSRLSKNHF